MDLVVYCSTEPLKGETIIGDSFETFQGGKGANQAVAVSRLGSSVSLIGKVGSDVFGQQLLKILGDENIDISMLKEHSGESGTAFIYVYKEHIIDNLQWRIPWQNTNEGNEPIANDKSPNTKGCVLYADTSGGGSAIQKNFTSNPKGQKKSVASKFFLIIDFWFWHFCLEIIEKLK